MTPPGRALRPVDFAAVVRADPILEELQARAMAAGLEPYLVGGAVRDRLLGRRTRDLDFVLAAEEAAAEAFLAAFAAGRGARVLPFDRRGVRERRVPLPDGEVDVVLAPASGLAAELARRDFTFNAVAVSLASGEVLDLFHGRRDLAGGVVRQITPECFPHDPLRALRAARFLAEGVATHLTSDTEADLRRHVAGLARCAGERVGAEMDRLALSGQLAAALENLDRWGALPVIAPEVAALAGVTQNRYHHLDAWRHTLEAVALADDLPRLAAAGGLEADALPAGEDLLVLRFAVLGHDLGKADTRTVDEAGDVHFYGHEHVSVVKAAALQRRWRHSRQRMQRVAALIRLHLRPGALDPAAGERAWRRLVHAAGADLDLLALLSLADTGATRGDGHEARAASLRAGVGRLRALAERLGEEFIRPRPLLGGREVMALTGLPPGPRVGALLERLLELQVDGTIRTRQEALDALPRLAAGLAEG